jgi:chorismate lyase/3-hydroxybenzoate synthase
LPNTLIELITNSDNNSHHPFEVWSITGEDVEHGTTDHCTWRRSNSLQFSAVTLPLSNNDDYEAVAYKAYKQLLSFIKSSPHHELVRLWNYIPFINEGAGDAENYKRFCSGRLSAFAENGYGDLQFPAASAVGHYQQGITVYALTASNTATHHTNPRQVDAFKYPRQYGPSSPSFARATTIELRDHKMLFISGTASILGHNTVHRDDLRLQLYTTNDNILYLLKENGFKRNNIETLRVYLRHQHDLAECQAVVEKLFPDTPAIYTHADICREELLVEIECFCVSA